MADSHVRQDGRVVAQWLCKCDCGGSVIKQLSVLKKTENAGCRTCESERRALAHVTHGGSHGGKTRLYSIWKEMRKRCNTVSYARYKDYGGRGIKICQEWADFSVFRAWAETHGYTDGLSIDRRDNDGGYHPDNCRLATAKIQSCNRRSAKLVILCGNTLNVSDAERMLGLEYGNIYRDCKRLNLKHQDIVNLHKPKLLNALNNALLSVNKLISVVEAAA